MQKQQEISLQEKLIEKNQILYYEDFLPDSTFELGEIKITKNDIIEFAEEFDPHPFHLDEEEGKKSLMGGLCASGWHLCGIIMRLACDTYIIKAASMGSFGMQEIKWIRPVFPGDRFSATCKILEARIAKSKPEMGILTVQWEGFRKGENRRHKEKAVDIIGTNLIAVRAPRQSENRRGNHVS